MNTDVIQYQTLINSTLHEAMQHKSLENMLREVVREELQHYGRTE